MQVYNKFHPTLNMITKALLLTEKDEKGKLESKSEIKYENK